MLEECATDQQLMTAGLSENNVSDALALIEERIDSIILVSKLKF